MKALILEQMQTMTSPGEYLKLVSVPDPKPGPGEIRVAITACGVCHTELDEIEGRTTPPRLPVIPGHEVVGRVDRLGENSDRFSIGDRVGVGWIHSSSGTASENLSPEFRATGRDVPGGYAEYMTVSEKYAYPIPRQFSDTEAAPLLCAGGVGYRALKLCQLQDGQTLGFTGFGGSAHLILQSARYLFPNTRLFVFARDPEARHFALKLGADWAGETTADAPEKMRAIIDTTPAWKPVVAALEQLLPGGRLVINAIRKEEHDKQELLGVDYRKHLWMEKEIKTVANVSRSDISEFLELAATAGIRPEVQVYPLEEGNRALADLKFAPVRGAKVLSIASDNRRSDET